MVRFSERSLDFLHPLCSTLRNNFVGLSQRADAEGLLSWRHGIDLHISKGRAVSKSRRRAIPPDSLTNRRGDQSVSLQKADQADREFSCLR